MVLETDIIFLDTNVFQSENFIEGNKLNSLLKTAIDNNIQVKIVDITYNECLKRIRESITKTKTLFKKTNASLNSEGRILRIIEDHKPYYDIPKTLNVEEEFLKVKKKFDEFLNVNRVDIINMATANHVQVFEQYFNQEPPFGELQKKDQFPDAFIISTIEHFATASRKRVFVVSSDNDILTYDSENFILQDGIATMLNTFVQGAALHKEYYDIIDKKIQTADEILNDSLGAYDDDLSLKLFEDLLNDPYMVELEYEPGDIIKTSILSSTITEFDINGCNAEYHLEVLICVPTTYNDLSSAIYDREDGRHWNVTNVRENSLYNLALTLTVDFAYEFYQAELIDFEIESISDFYLLDWEKQKTVIEEKSEFADW